MTKILDIQKLNLVKAGRRILDDITCSIDLGENLIILGANGAGKSTLLKTIIGTIQNYTGIIKVSGNDLKQLKQIERARLVSYVPQELPQDVRFNVREFVMLGRYSFQEPLSSNSIDDQNKVDHALEITGCQTLSRRRFDDLSSGERQRVMIASSLVQETCLILLDEPTSFLDIKQYSDVLELLKNISSNLNVSLVCVTHDINVATYFGGNLLVLADGRSLFHGNISDWLTTENLKKAYGREFQIIHSDDSDRITVIPK